MALNFNANGAVKTSTLNVSAVKKPKQRISPGNFLERFKKQATPKEVMFFNTQLALMLEIGTPLTVALKSVAEEVQNPSFQSAILEMAGKIEAGRQLSEAMKGHPKIFSEFGFLWVFITAGRFSK